MKNLIKTLAFVGIVLFSFSGCADKADYEDKELSKFFIKNNKEKLNRIISVDNWYREIQGGSYITEIKLSYLDFFSSKYLPSYIEGCDFTMFISNKRVEFLKSDVIHYGKEHMYKQAQKCLDSVIRTLDGEEKSKQEEKNRKSIQEKKASEILDKKFNENEVK